MSTNRKNGTLSKVPDIWVDPKINKMMKGSGGDRAFNPAAEKYREAYLAKQRPKAEIVNVPHYEIAREEEKQRPTGITIPTERPGKVRFPME